MKPWRLIDTGVRTAAENLALDETLLEARSKNIVPDTLRFLQFSPPAVLIGYHQSVAQEIRTDYCRQHGIDINRRITGGGTIFFDEPQLGWELISTTDGANWIFTANQVQKKISDAIIHGLKQLGITTAYSSKNDIEINGKKISGMGGVEKDNAFLFQGTLLTDFDTETMLKSLRVPIEKLSRKELNSVKERVTCLKEQLTYLPSIPSIKQAIKNGFEKVFGVRIEPAELTTAEQSMFLHKLKKFQSTQWIYMIDAPPDEKQMLTGAYYSSSGGLIRVSLALDRTFNRITDVLVTGDFFCSPNTAVYELEKKLKYLPATYPSITNAITSFFNDCNPRFIGLTASDFIEVVLQTLKKTEYIKYGIPLSEVNHVFTVNGNIEQVFNHPLSLVMFPYCAKHTECELRYTKKCDICGRCTVGFGYQLAHDRKLPAVTITDFEDLKYTLDRAKKEGVHTFLGSCCESFWVRHQPIFKETGIPGILVDIDNTTCYELGVADQALDGNFKNQTNLKIPLLQKIINNFRT